MEKKKSSLKHRFTSCCSHARLITTHGSNERARKLIRSHPPSNALKVLAKLGLCALFVDRFCYFSLISAPESPQKHVSSLILIRPQFYFIF